MHKLRSMALMTLGIGLIGIVSTARAELRLVETSEILPTASVVELPRTYLVPTMYVPTRSVITPTSVILPTSTVSNVYGTVPTTYYVPSTYVPTRYYRAFRPRRYLETTYVSSYPTTLTPTYYITPSTYLAPTSFVTGSGLVATSANVCCETASAPVIRAAPAPVESAPIPAKATQKSVEAPERRPGATLDSSVAEPEVREVNKPVRDEGFNTTNGSADTSRIAPGGLRNTPAGNSNAAARDVIPSAPLKTVVPKEVPVAKDPVPVQSSPVVKPSTPVNAADASKAATDPKKAIPPPAFSPPAVPDPDPIAPPLLDEVPPLPKNDDATRRNSLKPVFPSTETARPKRNVLEGKIVSADSLNAEENVEVVITDQTGRYLDRTTRTNAFGQFAISLPEGDWTIRVTMPSGRTLAVEQGQVTANAGRIIDMYGRNLTNLVIKR